MAVFANVTLKLEKQRRHMALAGSFSPPDRSNRSPFLPSDIEHGAGVLGVWTEGLQEAPSACETLQIFRPLLRVSSIVTLMIGSESGMMVSQQAQGGIIQAYVDQHFVRVVLDVLSRGHERLKYDEAKTRHATSRPTNFKPPRPRLHSVSHHYLVTL